MKHLFLPIALLAWLLLPRVAAAQADGFIQIAPDDYPVTPQGLPEFAVQLPCGGASGADVSVVVEFPEYLPLTNEEAKLAERHGFAAKADVEPSCIVGRSRGKVSLDVRFCPVVRKGGQWLRLVSCKLAVRGLGRPAPDTPNGLRAQGGATEERYASESVLASGKWVKISVPGEGIYQLTNAALAEMGFPDPARVKLYGYGGRILPENLTFTGDDRLIDDLEEVPLCRRDGSLIFFAEGTVRWSWSQKDGWTHANNVYASASCYFLTEGDSPAAFGTLAASTQEPAQTLDNVTGLALLDDDAFCWYQGGREFFDAYDFATGNTHSFRLNTPDVAADGAHTVDISFSASHASRSTTAEIALNEKSLGRMTVRSIASEVGDARVKRARFYPGTALAAENTFRFVTTQGQSARLNYIRVAYARTLNAQAAPYAFRADASGAPVRLRIANATAQTRLWRIGRAGVPAAEVPATLEGSSLLATVEGSGNRYVIADMARAYPAPQVVGTIGNQNLHADRDIDMVIVVPPSDKLTAEAERLAAAHREVQGLRVKVVRADRIYNEFSSGTPDATAIRRYMKMLYDRADDMENAPRFLLLFGDCANDNRMNTPEWKGFSPDDFLPSFEVNGNDSIVGTLYSYVTDDYFGYLDDGEGANITKEKVDLGIGRFTCHTAADAAILVDKSIRYMRNEETGTWKNTIAILGDDGDGNEHMEDAKRVAQVIETVSESRLTLKKYYWDAYPLTTVATGNRYPELAEQLKLQLNRGFAMVNYSGHGNPEQISHERVLLTDDFKRLTTKNLALWVLASCEIAPYDSQEESLCQAAMLNPGSGAIAFMCASRGVYATWNNSLNRAYCRQVLSWDERGRRYSMGDAMRLAKNEMVDGADTGINKLKYALIGDPALVLATPTGTLQIDSIDGEAIDGESKRQLKAGATVRFSGRAFTPEGDFDGSFTGVVTGSLYDRVRTITCNNNTNATKTFSYTDRGSALTEVRDSIIGGRFAFHVRIPYDISYTEDTGQLTLYGVSNDKSVECNGKFDRFYMKGTAETAEADTLGPEVFVYLDTPDFPDGGNVGTSALFVAEISDDHAINSAQADNGHSMELSLDDNANVYSLNDYFEFDFGSYRKGTVSYPLDNLGAGKHTLRFKVWDVNGNSTTSQLRFHVSADGFVPFDINATNNPASTATTFITMLDEDAAAGACRVATEVYDLAGRRVWTHERVHDSPVSYSAAAWDLTGNDGRGVLPGIYLYRSIIQSESGKRETKTKKIIVVKK